jgi:hypothetical protein
VADASQPQALEPASRTQSVEVIVHADADDVFPGVPSVGDLIRGQSCGRCAVKAPVIAFKGKPVKPRLGRHGVRARDRARRDADVTVYPWRHALDASSGVNKWEVQGQLGHRGGATERYAEFAPDYQQAAPAAIERSGSGCKTSEPAPSQSVGAFPLRI